ncbi:MAG: hypothetical protein HOH33_05925 [Verrucomicrobia bacterium]|nr:hypothetical protein [Verrucomicrobiota bacterium]
MHFLILSCFLGLVEPVSCISESAHYSIQVIDAKTKRGVPLVELRTVHHVSFWTDNLGYVAMNEPEWWNKEIFFHVHSDGYEYSKDGFGNAGVRLRPEPGKIDIISIDSTQVADRMYRITGAGRFRYAHWLGVDIPTKTIFSDGGVVGLDSAQSILYQNRIHWFWGDTSVFRYPLGNFRTTGAVSLLPSQGGLFPSLGVDLEYFLDENGTVLQMCPMPPKGDLIWIDGLLTLEDDSGQERMVAHYSKRKSLAEQIEHGLVVFDDDKHQFQLLKKFEPENTWQHPCGHPIRIREDGKDYLVFGDVFYHTRVPADWSALMDVSAFECLGRLDADGASYQWQKNAAPVTSKQEQAWIHAGTLNEEQAWFLPKDTQSGNSIHLHRGSVRWNPFRERFILIANQIGGSSMLGEVWYAESGRPEGPWESAVKIASHANYSFYNPVHREFFDEEGGRFIYFEGTYVTTFSGNNHPVPGYDYNQLMYRLDLSHPELKSVHQ